MGTSASVLRQSTTLRFFSTARMRCTRLAMVKVKCFSKVSGFLVGAPRFDPPCPGSIATVNPGAPAPAERTRKSASEATPKPMENQLTSGGNRAPFQSQDSRSGEEPAIYPQHEIRACVPRSRCRVVRTGTAGHSLGRGCVRAAQSRRDRRGAGGDPAKPAPARPFWPGYVALVVRHRSCRAMDPPWSAPARRLSLKWNSARQSRDQRPRDGRLGGLGRSGQVPSSSEAFSRFTRPRPFCRARRWPGSDRQPCTRRG